MCSLLAFWALGSGWMLLWGLAAVIPVIIHLWNHRQQAEVRWAAMEFLVAAVRKQARRIRLQQWTLLALRVLLLLLLAVAVANPVLSLAPASTRAVQASGAKHTLLLLDGSYSMACLEAERTNFAAAKVTAARLVDQSLQGDGFTLLVMGDPPQIVIGDVVFDRQDVLDQLESLELRHTGGNLLSTLEEAARLIRQTADLHPRFSEHQICLFTDLGLSTWGDVQLADVRQRLAELSERARLVLYEVGSQQSDNLAITHISIADPLPTVGHRLRVDIEVANFGAEPRESRLELLVDGRSVAEQRLVVPAEGAVSPQVPYQFDLPGPHVLEARLQHDLLEVDNHRWLAVRINEAIRILCVAGKQGAADFIELALAPDQDRRGRLRPEVVGENALLERDLHEFDCLFLCNIGRVGQQEADVLYEYVVQGGGLVTVLGDRVQADSYNERLGGGSGGRRLLPAQLGPLRGQSTHRFVPRYEHPIVEPFRQHVRSGLLTSPTWRFMQLTSLSDNAEVALWFDQDQEPALVTESIGRGRSILFATAMSTVSVDLASTPPTPWTALATWPSFPPLVHELVRYALGGKLASRNVRVGEPLTARLDDRLGQALSVELPTSESAQILVSHDEGLPRWSFHDTHVSGAYRVRTGDAGEISDAFAVNLDTRESDLARLGRELLPSQLSSPRAADPPPVAPGEISSQTPLFRLLLSVVLALLIGESCWACWLGRRAA